MSAALRLTEFPDRESASAAAATACGNALASAITGAGRASLMVSGGSTPTRLFNLLSGAAVAWEKVTVGLVDERWVPPDDPDSNERLVRRNLLLGAAAAAGLIPMWAPSATAADAAPDRDRAYAAHCKDGCVAVLGMGTDGHTASWFPDQPELAQLTARDQARTVVAVHATGAIVPERMTLTGAAILNARFAALLVFGAEKRSILLRSASMEPERCPVRFAIDGLGDRLSIFWAP